MSETAYFADRSPTGHALGVLVTRHGPSEPWTYLPDEGGARRTLTGESPTDTRTHTLTRKRT